MDSIDDPAGFWPRLPRPFFALAPMEDVTDLAFRDLISRLGSPHIYFTEFVKADGVARNRRDSMRRLAHRPGKVPVVAQIWGNNPEDYRAAVPVLDRLGFDGVDINMGCPQHSVTAKGCCSALIRTPALASELILAAKEAAASLGRPFPVSVKTRVSFTHPVKADTALAWISKLLDTAPAALTIHGRSAAQQSEGLADWTWVTEARKERDRRGLATRILGNGDVASVEDGLRRYRETGADGIMVGRGIFANPYFFTPLQRPGAVPAWNGPGGTRSPQVCIDLALEHLDLWERTWGEEKNYEIMKKFFKIYLQGFEGADRFREGIMATHSIAEARDWLLQGRDATLPGS